MLKLSIVVPTRERSDTLFHAIRTLVDQDYQACEIIISDNDSKDNTREVVESFSDTRIRYINTGKRVSMSDNWEFALRHVRGDYVTYIGDDDGFIPGAVEKAMALMEKAQVDALVWRKVNYGWPDHVDENLRNRFFLAASRGDLQVAYGPRRLAKVMKFHEGYNRLPSLYNGIIHRSSLNKVIELSTNNVFFNSISPDVFSGIALSMVVDEYLLSEYPFSVDGTSRHSIGTSSFRAQGRDIDSPAAKFMSENSREYDSRIQMAPSLAVCIMGEYLFARQFLPTVSFPGPYWNHYVRTLIRHARGSFAPEEFLRSAAHSAKSTNIRIKVPDQVLPSRNLLPRLGFQGDSFSFKAPFNMVKNVYDACQLIAGMLPASVETDVKSPLTRFGARIAECIIAEGKSLYRAC